MKGQIVADFIVQHRIDKQLDLDIGYVTFTPWKLLLTQNVHSTPITQQAEKASFARAESE
jgi:hypothetical protein